MKLGTKIFFFVTIFFSVIFLVGGYTLLSGFYEAAMEREVEAAVEQYQYNKFVLQSALITKGEEWFQGVAAGEYDVTDLVSDMNHTVAFFSLDGTLLFSGFGEAIEDAVLFSEAEEENVGYRFLEIVNRRYLLVTGKVTQGDTGVCLVTGIDVERTLEEQEQMIWKFGRVYAVAIGIGILLILFLSAILTRPIKRLTEAAKLIAAGEYQERIAVSSADEVGQLARHFNQMADAIEEKMQELSGNAQQKEDFVANFAHELKTPLTSIIGYADRIYQKELPRAEQKQAAWYIWNEGMRLEALALKLMDLTVLNHGEFVLQEMQAEELLCELVKQEEYRLAQKEIVFHCEAEPAYIRVECDLFQTLFRNLIDNSVKAGADHIQVRGYIALEESESFYVIQAEDNGSGIPAEEIGRITEAFYMVDKSRSRKLHGAGIGLSLAERIAELHGCHLEFESDGESGTKVSMRLCCKGGNADEERKA